MCSGRTGLFREECQHQGSLGLNSAEGFEWCRQQGQPPKNKILEIMPVPCSLWADESLTLSCVFIARQGGSHEAKCLSLWDQRSDSGVYEWEAHVWSCMQVWWWTTSEETGLSQWYIWKRWVNLIFSFEAQTSTSSPGRQDQCNHSQAWDVEQPSWSRNYWCLWEAKGICWNQWLRSHHSDLMYQATHLFPWRILWKIQPTVLSMTESSTCRFQLCYRGPVHMNDIWSHSEAEVYSSQLWEFGLGVEREYPLGHKAVGILSNPIPLSYIYEMGFTAATWSEHNIKHDLRVAVSSLQPLC